MVQETRETDLAIGEDGAIAVEELERTEYLALYEDSGQYDSGGPVTSTDGSLEEPLLQR